jgi:hypothetical protein
MMLLLLVLLLLTVRSEFVLESHTIVNQSGVSMTAPLQNKLLCQNFTDILPQLPLLVAADDFVLPGNLTGNLTVFQMLFSVIRLRNDADPLSLTVTLHYSDPATNNGTPGLLFFNKTVVAPGNPAQWDNTTLGQVGAIGINISQGEACNTNASVLFDFNNTVFLPRQTRLWVALYATGPRNMILSPYSENSLSWCTSGAILESEMNQSDNGVYCYRDASNILRKGLLNWTVAPLVERRLSLNSSTYQMAWTLTLLALAPPTWYEKIQEMATKEAVIIVVGFLIATAVMAMIVFLWRRRCQRRAKMASVIHEVNLQPAYGVEVDLDSLQNPTVWDTKGKYEIIKGPMVESKETSLESQGFTHQDLNQPTRHNNNTSGAASYLQQINKTGRNTTTSNNKGDKDY